MDAVDFERVVHLSHKAGEHAFGLMALALQVLHDPPLSFGEDDVNGYGVLLPEAPAAADGLVVLLKAVRRKVGNVVAVLEVQAPGADLGFGDQHPGATFREVDQAAFLGVVTVGP